MEYQSLLDLSHDAKFADVPNLKWTPWVGQLFHNGECTKKLLIVGESHYAKASRDESIEAVREKHEINKSFTREVIWECPISREWRNSTLDNIPRLFLGTSNYKEIDFWSNIAFYNFVQRMVLYTQPPERPNGDDFIAGWSVFCEVVELLRPDYCIFLGSEAHHSFWSAMKTRNVEFSGADRREKIGRFWGYRSSVKISEQNVPIVFVKHPGRYFSPTAWHAYLLREFPDEIAEMKAAFGT